MIPWKTFKFRRKLNLANLVKEEKLDTYDKLVEYLRLLHVEAPSVEVYDKATEAPAKSTGTAAKKSTTTRKPATRKKAAPKANTKVDEDPSEVWEAGLEGSYSEKKPAKTAKRTTRRTRTTKKKS